VDTAFSPEKSARVLKPRSGKGKRGYECIVGNSEAISADTLGDQIIGNNVEVCLQSSGNPSPVFQPVVARALPFWVLR
jgi:hypothetical protein